MTSPSSSIRQPDDVVLLLLDASIVGVAAALVRVKDGRAEVVWDGAHAANAGSVQAIAGLVDGGLAKAGVAWKDVGGLVASVGPGSFTGIKVGLAFVYGLRSSRIPESWPTLGVSALECAAEFRRRALDAESVTLLLPATRTHGFGAVAAGGRAHSVLIDAEAGVPTDWAAWAKAANAGAPGPAAWLEGAAKVASPAERVTVVGSWPLAEARLVQEGCAAVAASPPEVSRWAIYGMADEAARAWPQGFSAVRAPEPRYLRLSTAEEKQAAARTP